MRMSRTSRAVRSNASTARAISVLTVVFETSRLSVQNVVESRRRRISPNGCLRRSPASSGTVCWFDVRQTSMVIRLSAMNWARCST